MLIFGDDGFRDIYNKNLLSVNFLNIFFKNLNYFLKKKRIQVLIIGYDTRKTHKNIISIINKNVFNIKEIYIFDKPITTPAFNFYLKKNKKKFGIMITASHFHNKYNGFKFFYNGNKLDKQNERLILSYFTKNIKVQNQNKIRPKKIYLKSLNYLKYINDINPKLNYKKVLFDFSNGSAVSLINKVNIFKNSIKINCKPNGNNINLNSGALELVKNKHKKIFKKFDYTIAFDGDADRISILSKKFGIIETEKLILIFIHYFLQVKKIKIISIVGTEITNPWFVNQLKKLNIKFYKSKVGDRNVISKQILTKSQIGFETSGHISFNHIMDGVIAAGLFREIYEYDENIIIKVLNIKIDYSLSKFNLNKNVIPETKKKISKFKNKNIKFILRKAIFDDVYRLYIFYNTSIKNSNLQNLLKYFSK